jgi:flagellar motility protein MotE (MotC chaperone)
MTYLSILLRWFTKSAVLAAVLFLFAGGTGGWAQSADQSAPSLAGAQRNNQEEAWEAQQKRDMARKENQKRQQDLKKDADKLLELATELKQYVDKTNENTLSIEVIKKAEEIEKLAHSVKDKMKQY